MSLFGLEIWDVKHISACSSIHIAIALETGGLIRLVSGQGIYHLPDYCFLLSDELQSSVANYLAPPKRRVKCSPYITNLKLTSNRHFLKLKSSSSPNTARAGFRQS